MGLCLCTNSGLILKLSGATKVEKEYTKGYYLLPPMDYHWLFDRSLQGLQKEPMAFLQEWVVTAMLQAI